MTQDEAFLPYTINSSLPTQPLPSSSLDGQVDTLTGNLRFTSTPIDEVRINASLTYNDRNNLTPQAEYDWITTDTGVAAPRANLPYSFKHTVGTIDGSLALTRAIRLYTGCTLDEFKRDLQEVEYTNEGKFRKAPQDGSRRCEAPVELVRQQRYCVVAVHAHGSE